MYESVDVTAYKLRSPFLSSSLAALDLPLRKLDAQLSLVVEAQLSLVVAHARPSLPAVCACRRALAYATAY
jgi:hypothetical protein